MPLHRGSRSVCPGKHPCTCREGDSPPGEETQEAAQSCFKPLDAASVCSGLLEAPSLPSLLDEVARTANVWHQMWVSVAPRWQRFAA
eukprot:6641855-Alexandrium_andersonii.AAC.1